MSKQNLEKQSIKLGSHKIPTRITVRRLKRVKMDTGLDLTSQDPTMVTEFLMDPLVTVEACYALYSDTLKEMGISEEDFEDLCGPEEIELFREEVTRQMKSFSRFWKILCIEMENTVQSLQSGNIKDLNERAEALKAMNQEVASGPSS